MLDNLNPTIYQSDKNVSRAIDLSTFDNSIQDLVDPIEVFDQIRTINDPEHPLTLEQLNVVQLEQIWVSYDLHLITVQITPTIPHCSMTTMIGLSVVVKLMRSFGWYWKYKVMIAPGSHQSEHAINKQLNDKERVAAAIENESLVTAINRALDPAMKNEMAF